MLTIVRIACYAAAATSVTLGCMPALPPPVAPDLQRAMLDTASATRVYTSAEVARPVISAPNNRPPSFRGARAGRAVFTFVVDTTGRVEVGTIELVPGSEPSIAAGVVRMLRSWRYVPAHLSDGRLVRQLAQLTVTKAGDGIAIRLSTDRP